MVTKAKLDAAVQAAKGETRAALQTVYDALNHGQKIQIVKDERVRALFDLYEVAYDD